MTDVSVLEVFLHGDKIGTLTHVGGDRTLFAFTDSYIADASRPLLSLGFKDEFGELITDFNPTQTRLLPWFSNLLPEDPLRGYLAGRARVKKEREFFLLWALGADLPGAVTVQPADGEAWPPGAQDGGHEHAGEPKGNVLRFSLAGVRLKFSAMEKAGGGLAIPAQGVGGDWIVKLPSRSYDGVPENEFSMMTLARHVGINIPPVQLVNVNAIENLPEGLNPKDSQAFAIQRFDRLEGGGAVHIEDFAQIFRIHPDDKYRAAKMRQVAEVIGIEGGVEDVGEFMRRLIFNALIGNSDMHLKNWSLIYPDRRHAALSPAYDFVSTIAYIPDEEYALKFSRTKRYDGLTRDELSHLAAKARLPERLVLDTAFETIGRFRQAWLAEKKHLPLAPSVTEAIERQLKIIPLIGESPRT